MLWHFQCLADMEAFFLLLYARASASSHFRLSPYVPSTDTDTFYVGLCPLGYSTACINIRSLDTYSVTVATCCPRSVHITVSLVLIRNYTIYLQCCQRPTDLPMPAWIGSGHGLQLSIHTTRNHSCDDVSGWHHFNYHCQCHVWRCCERLFNSCPSTWLLYCHSKHRESSLTYCH
jgi:hypothetical protein